MIADMFGIIQHSFTNYLIDSLTSRAKLSKLPVLRDSIAIDFNRENI